MSFLDGLVATVRYIYSNGVAKPQRNIIDFTTGFSVTDNGDRLTVAASGGGGGVDLETTGTPADIGTAALGTSIHAAHGDHAHAHGNLAGGSFHAAAIASGASGFLTGSDKAKLDGVAAGATNSPLSSATPAAIGAAAAGSSSSASKDDHVHAHGNQSADSNMHAAAVASGTAGFLTGTDKAKLDGIASGAAALSSATPAAVGTAAAGSGTTASKNDHVHAHGNQSSDTNMHAAVVAAGASGFMTGADKTKLDGIATGATAVILDPGPIWVVNSAQASSVYANGVVYVPCRHSASDYIEFQCAVPSTTASLKVRYAMSASSSNNVRMRLDYLVLNTGDNPATAATTGTAFTVTPGNDTNVHEMSSSDGSDLALSVTAGKTVYCKLYRLGSDGADTHTGDLRIIEMRLA